jgi:cation-transporting P-type ATPase E
VTTEQSPALDHVEIDESIDPDRGLTSAQVAERIAAGKVNDVPSAPSRTTRQIVRANVFTRFNFLMGGLAAVVFAAGAPADALFLGVVVANIFIGIFQELRAKHTLDKLAVLNAPKARAVRDGQVQEIAVNEIVLDEILDLKAGLEVTADAIVRTADNLELDESLLTGEADPVVKESGHELLSGSFVVAGRGRAQVHRVGRDAYASQLAEEARKFTLVNSELRNDVNRIILLVTYALVPTAILLFISQFRSSERWQEAVVGAVAGVVGMVPEGLVLLTSVAFAVGVLRLARRRTLVQELPAIEVLARVDILCLDKTGTITEGALDVSEVCTLDGASSDEVRTALGAFAMGDPDPNATLLALREYCGDSSQWRMTGRVPFSSARKWSAASFEDHGWWVFGAPENVLGDGLEGALSEHVSSSADQGYRVLVFAHTDSAVDGEQLPADLSAVALVLFEDRIRADASETLSYFAAQDVTLKVISGDNPRTVAAVASRAGLSDASRLIDARQLAVDDLDALSNAIEENAVFGRVTPHQKRAMVKALQARGHTVGMTGDGVNDVLALKDSDCGIAMASGSEATRSVAQLVLLDSNFAGLPKVVAEGRRVINNIQRVASLFLVKTTYSFLLALATGVATFPYPFRPRHLTLISGLTIGIPSFFLALAPNDERVKRGFLQRVLSVAIPGGLIIAVATLIAYGVARLDDGLTIEQDRTAAVIVAAGIAFVVLVRVARPLNPLRLALVATMIGLFALALLLPLGQRIFQLELPDLTQFVVDGILIAVSWPFIEYSGRVVDRIVRWWFRRYEPDEAEEYTRTTEPRSDGQ